MLSEKKSIVSKLWLPIIALAVMLCVFFPKTAYARDVRVFFNGNEIKYAVPAMLINDRTMVPLSQTFEALVGMGTVYDAATRTSTFSANGNTYRHTIGTNILYKNGVPMYYEDAYSTIVVDRALVPIRMIIDSCGMNVEWDPYNYYVLITNQAVVTPTPVPIATPVTPAQPTVQIISFEANKTTLNSGESVVLTLKTTSTATNVWINDGTQDQAMAYATLESNGIKTWVLAYTPKNTVNIQGYANTTQNLAGAAQKALAITVNTQPPQITQATPDKSSIALNETVTLTIKTNSVVNNVWIECNNTTYDATYVNADAAGVKTWTVQVNPSTTQQIRISANTSKNATGAATQSLSITVGPTSSMIHSAVPNKTSINAGDSVMLTIKTNSSTQYVWVEYNGGSFPATPQGADASGIKTWTHTFYPNASQQIRIAANTTNTLVNAAATTQYITVANQQVSISNGYANPQTVTYGQQTTLYVTTNTAATHVWAETPDGSKITLYDNSPPNQGYKTWQATYTPQNSGTINVYAGKASGSKEHNYSFGITVSGGGQGQNPVIYSSTPEPGYVSVLQNEKTYNTFKIKTNTATTSVFIYFNGQTQSIYTYEQSGNERSWVITVPISWSGTGRYGFNYEEVKIEAYSSSAGKYDTKIHELEVRS